MRVGWSRPADSDLEAIFDYIAGDNPSAARRIQRRILETAARLGQSPRRGRPGGLPATRELVVGRSRYIIVYRVEADVVWIVRIRHAAQDWPPKDN